MGILAKLFGDAAGSGIGSLFKTVMDEFHLAPEKKAEMEMQLAQLQAQAAQADADMQIKLNDIAGQNIRVETSSNDAFVRRARPAFLWLMTVAIFVNIVVFPLINKATGGNLTALAIDANYIDLFKISFLGYVAGRTFEKYKGTA